jgi:hypothetical protein
MLDPPSDPSALAVTVSALAAEADAVPMPDPLLDGWASFAALEYQAAVCRVAVGLLRMRSALHDAAAALKATR